MRMRRQPILNTRLLLLLLLTFFGTCVVVSAQSSSCSLKPDQLANAPELFGVRLGMTPQEVKTPLPLIQFGRADPFGVMKTSFNPHFDPRVDQTAFPDVRTISLDFLDGKLVTLWIGYEATFKWPKLDEFVANFGRTLDLRAAWTPKRSGREVACDGFSVFASIIADGPSIRIMDDEAQNTIATRREEAAAAAE